MMMYFTQIKRKLNENKNEIAIAVLVLLGILLVKKTIIDDLIPYYATFLGHADEEQFIYNLSDDDVIVQEFLSPHDFDFISLHFSNHEQSIPGKTYLSLTDVSTGDQLSYLEVDNSSISYDKLVEIAIPGGGKKDVPYSVTASFEGMGDSGLGIFGYEADDSYLPACNLSDQYAVAVGTHINTPWFQRYGNVIVFYIGLMALWFLFVFTKDKWKEERRFLAIAIPIGIFFLLFLAVNPVYDGDTHLSTSYNYSNYLFPGAKLQTKDDHIVLMKDEVNAYNFGYDVNFDFQTDREMLNKAYIYSTEFSFISRDRTWEEYNAGWITYNASLSGYFPAVIAITVGRIFHMSVWMKLLLAKAFMMATYIIASYFAIRIVPNKKILMMFAALIPMNLCEAAGITYDTIVVAAGLLLTAILLRAYSVMLNWKDLTALTVCCFILGANKGGVYLLIPFVFLVVPKFVNGKAVKRWKIWLSCACGSLLGVFPTMIHVYSGYIRELFGSSDSAKADIMDVASVNMSPGMVQNLIHYRLENGELLTFKDVSSDPIRWLKMLVSTLVDRAGMIIGQLIGDRMAWTDDRTNWIIIAGFIGLLILAAVQRTDDEAEIIFPFKLKILIGMLLVAEVVLIAIVMTITETGTGDHLINGIQGRYFLPWAALIPLMFTSERLRVDERGIRVESFVYSMFLVAYGFSYFIIFFKK